MAAQQEQPDFGVLVHNINQIAQHVDRFRNLPALNNGQQILNELRQLSTRVDTVEFRV